MKLAALKDTRVALENSPVGIADMVATLKSVRSMVPNCTDLVVRQLLRSVCALISC